MQARLIRTEGARYEATVEIEGQDYCVMDCLSHGHAGQETQVGEVFNCYVVMDIDEDVPLKTILSGNPDCKQCIEQIQSWKYRALGKIVSIDPVRVDCGVLVEEGVIHTNDENVVGEFIGFTILRICMYRLSIIIML